MSPKKQKKHPSTSNTKQKKKKSRRVTSASDKNGKTSHSRSTPQKQASQQHKGNSATQNPKKIAKHQKYKKKEVLSDHPTKQVACTFQRTIQDYLDDHEGGNHSHKTIEWHQTALRLMQSYMEEQRGMTLVSTIEATDISAWFTHLRKTPGARGKRSEEHTS